MKLRKKDFKKKETQRLLESEIKEASRLSEIELFNRLDTTNNGLSSEAAEQRLELNGKNLIQVGKKQTSLTRLVQSTINPFNVILLVIAVVSYFTDVFFSDNPDYLTIIIILGLIVLASTVSFIQSEKSNSAAEKLSKLVTNQADVIRDGQIKQIQMEEIVIGDIVKLSAGDMIPADVRFLTTKDTFVAQSALTGESHPVEKHDVNKSTDQRTITDLDNIGFTGSNIISGSATAVVVKTGNSTFLGSISKVLSGERAKKSFERGVNSVSLLLIRLTLLMVPTVFLINGILKGDWVESLLFSVSVAVGLTPEMLPVIMTATLAKGAVSMSKHQVIVKSLGAIQTFGEMNVLCTDKTGTLTEDRIILEKYMNLRGYDDNRVLRHAFLNSYFQTGLKNLIDLAVIEQAHKQNFADIIKKYQKVDEIPFDFTRRRMSVVLQDDTGKRQLITKGAVEEMLSISSYAEIDGKVEKITEQYRDIAMATYLKYNNEGLRILAVAQKNEVPGRDHFSTADESDLVIIGFIGFLDPPKESAKEAISKLKEHGVRTIILTGDSEGVTAKVCSKIGVSSDEIVLGFEIDQMDDKMLKESVQKHDVYAKLSPRQKERIVDTLQQLGHTVGYMGDGINDALALHQADVGISVDSAVDIAKETADIILLKKDLMVLEEGVVEGRRTFGNITKYIKMAASGNFGNMIAVVFASIFLPFLPMLPIHILTQNLLNDFSQMGIPFDNVDKEYLKKPRKWNSKSIRNFTFVMGPISSIFDILTFGVLWFVIKANTAELAPLFQAGWFVFGTISQILVIYVIRTRRIPFIQSLPTKPVIISTLLVTLVAIAIGFTAIGISLDMMVLPAVYLLWLFCLAVSYIATIEVVKRIYIRIYGEWM